eukprot:1180061-Prorocentrum_minimum.AAC.3
MEVAVKWSGKEYIIKLDAEAKVEDLKRRLAEETHVLPKKQKVRASARLWHPPCAFHPNLLKLLAHCPPIPPTLALAFHSTKYLF